jgi:hypothetical protein
MTNTYWNDRGTYNEESKALQALIPLSGTVAYPRTKNKHLERFRKAVNAYYDLYNNGLWNRARQFANLFKLYGLREELHYGELQERTVRAIETVMDEYVLLAYKEQVALGNIKAKEETHA